MKTTFIILWIARITAGIFLAFMLFMIGAHIVEGFGEPTELFNFSSTEEMLSFFLFPLGLSIGLLVCFWKPKWGGILVVADMIAFHFIRPDLIFDPMIDGLAVPGILFLLYAFMKK